MSLSASQFSLSASLVLLGLRSIKFEFSNGLGLGLEGLVSVSAHKASVSVSVSGLVVSTTTQKETHANCVAVRCTEIKNAAGHFAELLEFLDLKASSGWLYRFYKRHGFGNKSVTGESGSVDAAAVGPFKECLQEICREHHVKSFELYNAETGLH